MGLESKLSHEDVDIERGIEEDTAEAADDIALARAGWGCGAKKVRKGSQRTTQRGEDARVSLRSRHQ